MIQEKYPAKQKCRCKNDYFKLHFNYISRIGTEDYRAVGLMSCCTECGKQKKFAELSIDYSPTAELFEQPIMHLITDGKKIKKYRYSIEGCSEYIEAGQVKAKSEAFCKLVQEFLLYSKERLN